MVKNNPECIRATFKLSKNLIALFSLQTTVCPRKEDVILTRLTISSAL